MQAVDVAKSPEHTFEWRPDTSWMIYFAVFVVHCVLLLFVSNSSRVVKPQKPTKKLIVHTVALQSAPKPVVIAAPPAPVVAAAPVEEPEPVAEPEPAPAPVTQAPPAPVVEKKPEPKPVSKPAPKPKSKPVSKPVAPKPKPKPVSKPKAEVKKKEPTPKPKPKEEQNAKKREQAAKETAAKEKAAKEKSAREQAEREKKQQQAKQQALIDKALLSLDSSGILEGKKANVQASASKGTSAIPSKISSLAADSLVAVDAGEVANCTPQERTYYDELVSRLKIALKLPEYGEVKLELTINRAGKVLHVKKVKSKSQKNSDYIQKAIPKLHLPPFGQNFTGENDHTFRLTLSNELNY